MRKQGYGWSVALACLAAGASLSHARAQDCDGQIHYEDGVRQVNISGATLFANFFTAPASTNDACAPGVDLDVDCLGDPFVGRNDNRIFCGDEPVDQMALLYVPGVGMTTWWLVQDRQVGSVNGYKEFRESQLCNVIPQSIPSQGLINRYRFDNNTSHYIADCDGDGDISDESRTPCCMHSIDLAILDVPSFWALSTNDSSQADWANKPGTVGYGLNPLTSSSGYPSTLPSLKADNCNKSFDTNTTNPTNKTIFDTPIAWVPIVYIANRGTGLDNVNVTAMQHLFVSGRLPNGENLVAATRSIGSGTRNGMMNTSCIDPSFGRGDNLGSEFVDTVQNRSRLGPNHQPTNCEGSNEIESVVEETRLAVGYTGLAGSSRAEGDASAGRYEVLNVCNDHQGASAGNFIRPNKNNILDNGDANTGWRLGGPESFVTHGDPLQTNPSDPDYMSNQDAAAYLNNITCSIQEVSADCNNDANLSMPGELLATTFFLLDGIDVLPSINDPCTFVASPTFSQTVQDCTRGKSTLNLVAYGTTSTANFVPGRDVTGQPYGDGSTNSNFFNPVTSAYDIPETDKLNRRNRIAGDFNGDLARNVNDIAKMMSAIKDPRAFSASTSNDGTGTGFDLGGIGARTGGRDIAIPEILGDFNGDGNFTSADIRYFADGLAMTTGGNPKLNRKDGFTRVDNEWQSLTGNGNYFGTALATGVGYSAGASRADIAGGASPLPGAYPNGSDGQVGCADITYVYANFGSFSDLSQAQNIDLSADINGDLVINQADVDEIVHGILCTEYGDVNLDGRVNSADAAIVSGNLGMTDASWCDGDVNGDGTVNSADLTIVNSHLGFVSSCLGGCASDGCSGTEALVAKTKAKGGSCQVKAILKKGIPGSNYGLVMPTGACVQKAANTKGKVVVKEYPSNSGTVSVPTCGKTATATCP